MSEIAVKIYEQKRDIKRYQLLEPILGKNGADQILTLIDADTKQPVDHILYAKPGMYRIESVILGHQLKDLRLYHVPETAEVLDVINFVDTNSAYRVHAYIYVREANTKTNHPFRARGLRPDTVLGDYYMVIRYQDE